MIILEQIDLNKSKEKQKQTGEVVPVGDKTAETVKLPTDNWKEVSGPYLDKLKSTGEEVKQLGGELYRKIFDKVSNNNNNNQEVNTDSQKEEPNSSSNTQAPDDTKIYRTPGDPYEYKVVDGQWFTKSFENRGRQIPDWITLSNNVKATNILDSRFPNARKNMNNEKNMGTTDQSANNIKTSYNFKNAEDLKIPDVDYSKEIIKRFNKPAESPNKI